MSQHDLIELIDLELARREAPTADALGLLDEVERLGRFLAAPQLPTVRFDEAVATLRAAFTKPREPVPVATVMFNGAQVYLDWHGKTINDYRGAKLYAHPPSGPLRARCEALVKDTDS